MLEKWAKKSENHEILAYFDCPTNFFAGSPQNFETSFGYFFSGTIARKSLDHAPNLKGAPPPQKKLGGEIFSHPLRVRGVVQNFSGNSP